MKKTASILLALSFGALYLAPALILGVPVTGGGRSFKVTTVAGTGEKGLRDGPGGKALFNWPTGVAATPDGTLYVADFSNHAIRRIDPRGVVSTFAGKGVPGYGDGVGTGAILHGPDNIAVDGEGNLFVADADNFRIRKIAPDGTVTTIAGNGTKGYRDGDALDAMFRYPTGVAVDREGNVYVADRGTHTVRKLTRGGKVVTIAGNGRPGYADGLGTMTHLREPISVAAAGDGTVYIADSGNNVIRKVTPNGVVTTLAGSHVGGYRDGKGSRALFLWPTGIAVDKRGNIFVCDSRNNKIRRITPAGVVTTVAGVIAPGLMDGPGYKSSFNFPTGIGVDEEGNIYVADSGNNAIRKITLSGPR